MDWHYDIYRPELLSKFEIEKCKALILITHFYLRSISLKRQHQCFLLFKNMGQPILNLHFCGSAWTALVGSGAGSSRFRHHRNYSTIIHPCILVLEWHQLAIKNEGGYLGFIMRRSMLGSLSLFFPYYLTLCGLGLLINN